MRVQVKGELLSWACKRSRVPLDVLAKACPKLSEWQAGTAAPTIKQLEKFAKATRTPMGLLFLDTAPVETVPIPDFRTVRNKAVSSPSADLMETVHICQQRQEWYRDFARSIGEEPLPFIGVASMAADIEQTAAAMREAIGFDLEERRQCSTWTEALRRFIQQSDELGVLVMVSGIVGSNTRRGLDPTEFRGFALSDALAPVVFINGKDSKSAQMFTLAHELAHLWLGESGLSDVEPVSAPSNEIEVWCNQVAAEFLVPMAVMRLEYRASAELWSEVQRLARRFKVSTLVILRRIHDVGGLSKEQMWAAYHEEVERLKKLVSSKPGGSFYNTLPVRVSRRLAQAVVVSTLEGQTLHRDAFHLLGFKKLETFRELAQRLGVA